MAASNVCIYGVKYNGTPEKIFYINSIFLVVANRTILFLNFHIWDQSCRKDLTPFGIDLFNGFNTLFLNTRCHKKLLQ